MTHEPLSDLLSRLSQAAVILARTRRGQTARLRGSAIQLKNQDLALSALEEAARFKPSISILSIFSMAFMTR
jgi:hypothetical protein